MAFICSAIHPGYCVTGSSIVTGVGFSTKHPNNKLIEFIYSDIAITGSIIAHSETLSKIELRK
jgi:hypothetical protein